ncbi:uncharacterized protein LOC143017592 [Oratosquilla oratoria]|uniref:uncharacterized protein LOC143017592 n=1 Tax=Oratosquilla oratoria TaxID=337810 RepID=UPI003F75F491
MSVIWQFSTILSDWKKDLVVPIWSGEGERRDCNNYHGKVLAHLRLKRLRSHQRPEQSGFTPSKSITDRILALRILVERRREFQEGFPAAYVDIKKAFDLVHRGVLWDLLMIRRIPARTID